MNNKELDAGTIFGLISTAIVLIFITSVILDDNTIKKENIKAFSNKESLICHAALKSYLVSKPSWQYKKINDSDYFMKDDFLIHVGTCKLNENNK